MLVGIINLRTGLDLLKPSTCLISSLWSQRHRAYPWNNSIQTNPPSSPFISVGQAPDCDYRLIHLWSWLAHCHHCRWFRMKMKKLPFYKLPLIFLINRETSHRWNVGICFVCFELKQAKTNKTNVQSAFMGKREIVDKIVSFCLLICHHFNLLTARKSEDFLLVGSQINPSV